MSRRDHDKDATLPVCSDTGETRHLYLVVLGEGLHETYSLPPAGAITIGRAEQNHVRVQHRSISRVHARLDVGPPLTICDLDSHNGVRIGRRRLVPGEAAEIAPGDAVQLGAVTVVVQTEGPRRPPAPPRGTVGAAPAGIVVEDPAMRELFALIDRVADSAISVLVLGETGVGKEVIAREIHRRSARASRPFLGLNCAALAPTLLESELFGHEKGAFTGAAQTKPGLLEAAQGGTVFLDELGELPMPVQVKLLRVIEERQVLRVGGLAPRPIDVRLVSATHRDLRGEVARGTFRQDLYFRLNGISLLVPPLCERPTEIARLAELFLARAAAASRASPPPLGREALALLRRYSWPGNIRELRNVMERAALLCTHGPVTPAHLPPEVLAAAGAPPRTAPGAPSLPPPASADGLRGEIEALERQRIIEALARCSGNQTRAAQLLGMPRRTLLKRIELYNLPRPRKQADED